MKKKKISYVLEAVVYIVAIFAAFYIALEIIPNPNKAQYERMD